MEPSCEIVFVGVAGGSLKGPLGVIRAEIQSEEKSRDKSGQLIGLSFIRPRYQQRAELICGDGTNLHRI